MPFFNAWSDACNAPVMGGVLSAGVDGRPVRENSSTRTLSRAQWLHPAIHDHIVVGKREPNSENDGDLLQGTGGMEPSASQRGFDFQPLSETLVESKIGSSQAERMV